MHPYCMCPKHKGLPTSPRSDVVDHIKPHRGDMKVFWDRSNWWALAKSPCHDSWKQREEHKGGSRSQTFRSKNGHHIPDVQLTP